MNELLWSCLLLLLGLGLLILEAFIPSGGVIGILCVLAFVGSVVVAFMGGWQLGVIMLAVTLVLVPLVIALALKLWPRTPIGRLVMLEPPAGDDAVLPENPLYRKQKTLVGRRGVAKTKMLPSGAVVIDGETFDAVSEGLAIDPGQPVRVIAVRTNRIVVRLEEPAALATGNADVLSQSAETLGLEPLDERSK